MGSRLTPAAGVKPALLEKLRASHECAGAHRVGARRVSRPQGTGMDSGAGNLFVAGGVQQLVQLGAVGRA
ncbi:hypothetical protein D3C77_712620 [compost metagenome]